MKFLDRIKRKSCLNCHYFYRIHKDALIMRCMPGRGTFCEAKRKTVNENFPKFFCMGFSEKRGLEEELTDVLEIGEKKKIGCGRS